METIPPAGRTPAAWPEVLHRRRRARRALTAALLASGVALLASGWMRAWTPAGAVRRPLAATPIEALAVDVGTAPAARLRLLPGIGPVRAAAIVRARLQHGPPRRLEDLERVPGIGRATIDGLRRATRVRVLLRGRPVGCGHERSHRPGRRGAPP